MSDESPFDDVDAGAGEATHFEMDEPSIDDAAAHGEASHADDPFGDAPAPAAAAASHGFEDDAFGEAPAAAEGAVLVLGDAPIDSTTGAADPFGEEHHHDGDANEDDIMFASSSGATESASAAAAAASASLLPAETPLSRWEAERREVLEERREAERVAKLKAGDDARAELAAFYKRREETLEAAQASNRVEEKNARADLDAVMSHGTQWEKVARMANLSATSGEGRDVARMRKLLIQLKMAKPTADGRGAAVGLNELSDTLDVPTAPVEGTRRSPSPSGAAAAAAKSTKKR